MPVPIGLVLAVAGLALVIYCAERLVAAVVGASMAFGLSAFVVSVVFVGFDPENLVVGAVGAVRDAPGIALGSVVGAAMVAAGLAFGLTALAAPMRFARAPGRVLALPVLAILLVGILVWDGLLSRLDGLVLLGAFALAVLELLRLSRRGLDVRASAEVAESIESGPPSSCVHAVVRLVLPLAGLIVGSAFLVGGSQRLMAHFGISETAFGMTILALAVSVEELARELPAAWRGRPDVSVGNVVGSVLAFFLWNAGMIAVIRPISVDGSVLRFYLPLCLLTVAVVMGSLATLRVSRLVGMALVALYVVFFVGAHIRGTSP